MRSDDRLMGIRREIAAMDRECANIHARLAVLAQSIAAAIAEKEGRLADVRDATAVVRACPHLLSRTEIRCLRARYIASEREWRALTIEERHLWSRMVLLTESLYVATAKHRHVYQRR